MRLDHTAKSARRALVAACVGTAVEWYDFAIYSALGVLVTPVFFPSQDTATVLLAAFAVYATAFLVRPVGAMVFGVMADARGRKPVLVGVVLMGGAAAAIGVLPGYATIGVLASCVVLLLRATRGLAAGLTVGGLLHLLPPARLEGGWWRIAFLAALPPALWASTCGVVAESPLFLQALRGQVLDLGRTAQTSVDGTSGESSGASGS